MNILIFLVISNYHFFFLYKEWTAFIEFRFFFYYRESVGKVLKPHFDGNQPSDWSTPENCAIQYEEIVSSLITPRKTFRISSVDVDQTIIKRLRQERISELNSTAERSKNAYLKLKGQIEAIQDGLQNHRLQEIWNEILRLVQW